jgi:hypothetical protein
MFNERDVPHPPTEQPSDSRYLLYVKEARCFVLSVVSNFQSRRVFVWGVVGA